MYFDHVPLPNSSQTLPTFLPTQLYVLFPSLFKKHTQTQKWKSKQTGTNKPKNNAQTKQKNPQKINKQKIMESILPWPATGHGVYLDVWLICPVTLRGRTLIFPLLVLIRCK